jgi:hypothetical protein
MKLTKPERIGALQLIPGVGPTMASGGMADMTTKLNAAWHKANRMPARASLDERVMWHVAHAKACSCRSLPASILKELKRRGVKPPSGQAA